MSDFNQFTIPFGKYINPNTLGKLELIKHEVIKDNLPIIDRLYLIKDIADNTLYCAFEPEYDEPNYHNSIAKEVMLRFAKTELGDNITIKFLKPKSEDWLPTHYLAVVYSVK